MDPLVPEPPPVKMDTAPELPVAEVVVPVLRTTLPLTAPDTPEPFAVCTTTSPEARLTLEPVVMEIEPPTNAVEGTAPACKTTAPPVAWTDAPTARLMVPAVAEDPPVANRMPPDLFFWEPPVDRVMDPETPLVERSELRTAFAVAIDTGPLGEAELVVGPPRMLTAPPVAPEEPP